MRKIKFRRPHFRYTDGGFAGFSYWGPVPSGFESPSSWSHCKPGDDQQYIGRKDNSKPPKEIYEGDIVKHRNGIKTVEWFNDSASFQMDLSDFVLDQEVGFDEEEVEIIGNIYENPGLLNE